MLAISIVQGMFSWISSDIASAGDSSFWGPSVIRTAIPFPTYWNVGRDGGGQAWIFVWVAVTAWAVKLFESDFLVQVMKVGFSPFVIGALSFYPLAVSIIKHPVGSLSASLIFSWNSHSLVGLHGGQSVQAASQTFIPIALFLIIQYQSRPGKRKWLKLAIATVAIQAIFDPRYSYITFFAIIMKIITSGSLSKRFLFENGMFLFFTILSVLIIQSPWLFGLLSNRMTDILPNTYTDGSMLESLSILNVQQAVELHHPMFPEYLGKSAIYKHSISAWYVVLGCLVLSGIWSGRKNQLLNFVGIVFCCAIFLAKGVQLPFDELNRWLFLSVPGMSAFRDPVKWLSLVTVCGSLFVGISISKIYDWLSTNIIKAYKVNYLFSFITILVFISWPTVWLFLNKEHIRNGLLFPRHLTVGEKRLNELLNMQSVETGPFRVLMTPYGTGSIDFSSEIELWSLLELKNNQWNRFVKSDKSFAVDFESVIGSEYFIHLLRAANFKYVVIPEDRDVEIFGSGRSSPGIGLPGFDEATELMQSVPGLVRRSAVGGFEVFEIPDHLPRAYVTNSVYVVQLDDVPSGTLPEHLEVWRGGPTAVGQELFSLPGIDGDSRTQPIEWLSGSRMIGGFEAAGGETIVLGEQYSDGWIAYLAPRSEAVPFQGSWVYQRSIMKGAWWWLVPNAAAAVDRWQSADHVRLNGYLQGWHVPRAGSYSVMIEYRPQRGYEAGWLVTVMAVCGAALAAGIGAVRVFATMSIS